MGDSCVLGWAGWEEGIKKASGRTLEDFGKRRAFLTRGRPSKAWRWD